MYSKATSQWILVCEECNWNFIWNSNHWHCCVYLTSTVGGCTPKVRMMMMKQTSLSELGPASPACTAQMTCEHCTHTQTNTHQITINKVWVLLFSCWHVMIYWNFFKGLKSVQRLQLVRPVQWSTSVFRSWSGCLKREPRRLRRNSLTLTAQMKTALSLVSLYTYTYTDTELVHQQENQWNPSEIYGWELL